ncbi:MAG: 50S ribosomal protein L18 [Phycisphaerae bacterium]|nr:50S ribosomal protein L18 [Phycisphaerae bacterium]
MKTSELKLARRGRRRRRVRRRVFGTPDRPRLTVSRSLKHVCAQLIDDMSGRTLCSAGTNGKSLAAQIKYGGNCEAAKVVGQLLGKRARMQGIRRVAFDRNGYRFHGRVKALAEAARETGLEF